MIRRPNILHYIETSGPGGAETVLINLAKNIDQRYFNSFVVLHKTGWLYDQLKVNNIDVTIIPTVRSWDVLFLFKMIRYCIKNKIDLIHSHLFGANLYACLAGALLRVPVMTTFHNELKLEGSADKYIRLKSFLIRTFTKKIVFVADYIKNDYIRKIGFPEKKMITIYNGVESDPRSDKADLDNLRTELGIAEDDFIIGHIANFRAPKGHRILIEAAEQVCKEYPSAKFLLVGDEGDGVLKNEIADLSKSLGIAENIKILGFRSDIHRLLDLIDIFVLSSTSEGMPLSVIEAMASGKPVVATQVGGLSEIVESEETGYLVEPGNPPLLAEGIISLLRDEELRFKMGQAGTGIIKERFSLQGMIRNYQVIYTELLR